MPSPYAIATRAASISLLCLIVLCVVWEMWLGPLRPGGSWLVLKAVPLLLPLRGILHRKRYTYQWTSLLCLAYLGEGLVRASSDPGVSRWYAAAETGLALTLFVAVIVSIRQDRTPRPAADAARPR